MYKERLRNIINKQIKEKGYYIDFYDFNATIELLDRQMQINYEPEPFDEFINDYLLIIKELKEKYKYFVLAFYKDIIFIDKRLNFNDEKLLIKYLINNGLYYYDEEEE